LNRETPVDLTRDEVQAISARTQKLLEANNYEEIKAEGSYIVAKKKRPNKGAYDVGDIRITFYKIPCGPTTVMAQ
jgi:hypothetical protein